MCVSVSVCVVCLSVCRSVRLPVDLSAPFARACERVCSHRLFRFCCFSPVSFSSILFRFISRFRSVLFCSYLFSYFLVALPFSPPFLFFFFFLDLAAASRSSRTPPPPVASIYHTSTVVLVLVHPSHPAAAASHSVSASAATAAAAAVDREKV